MENSNNKGWNAGAHPTSQPNPTREPNRPMTQSTETDNKRSQYNRPFQQPEDGGMRQSNEYSSDSAVMEKEDSSSGWSGMLHKFASKLSDSKFTFWLPLLFTNRANVVEGITEVVKKAHIPDLIKDMNLKHEWEHNRKALVTKVAVGTAVAAGVYALVRWNNQRKQSQV